MVSVMLYLCMFCVALSMDLFVLCVACLTVFVTLHHHHIQVHTETSLVPYNLMTTLNYISHSNVNNH